MKHRTVQTWIHRYGWRELRDKTKAEMNPPTGAEPDAGGGVVSLPREESALSRTGDKVRETLAKSLEAQALALADEGKGFKRADLTGRDGTAQATKTLADAAATVFGWGDTQPGGLIVVGEVERAMDTGPAAEEVTDVQTVQPAAGQPVIDVTPVVEGLPAPEPKPSLGGGPVEVQTEVVPLASEPGASC